MTKLYFDTEFTGLQLPTSLISIGIVSDTGKTFYAEFTDYNKNQLNEWINKNVISNLKLEKTETNMNNYRVKGSTATIRMHLRKWLAQFDKVVMVSDCLAYDWVLFCDLFGNSFSIPKNIYYIPIDICSMFLMKDIDPDIDREQFAEVSIKEKHNKHNALFDALVIKACYEKLTRDVVISYNYIS